MTSTGSWTKVKRAPAASRPVNSDARCNPDVPVSRSRRPRIAPTPARTQPFLELLTRRNCSIKRGRQDGGSALPARATMMVDTMQSSSKIHLDRSSGKPDEPVFISDQDLLEQFLSPAMLK